uniref:Bifunctional inhibitor/plant lipid transfer protein/seed storage helical domain-containing protein n=1 Tax=Oryza rufipogon TaxID=4529 RepID=A0A0E0MZ27_ORYRU
MGRAQQAWRGGRRRPSEHPDVSATAAATQRRERMNMAAVVVAHVPVFPAPGVVSWPRRQRRPSAAGAFLEVPPATPCAVAIVSVAPCLAHVAVVAPPARPAPAPTEACCAAFLRGVSPSGGGGEGCFCHLLRDPLLLGFPVNTARLGALLPTCAAANANASAAAAVEAATLFADTCRDLKSLPEMRFLPDPPPTPTISPAAVPGSMPPTTEERSTPVPVPPQDRSGSETSTPSRNFLVVLLALTAAAAADLIQL